MSNKTTGLMSEALLTDRIRPLTTDARKVALDGLRGTALLGVLLVNLEVGFRVSLFQHMLMPHTHEGWANRAVDIAITGLFEFKAFTLFSVLFGVGIGIQAERAAAHQINAARFFARRFVVLLAIGLCHVLLLWNGDILTLYAVCGLLLLPLVAISAQWLARLGIVLIVLSPYLPFFDAFFPTDIALRDQAALATRVYPTGSFAEIAVLRCHEAWHFIAPLLLNSLPRTLGLILLGIAVWRCGVLQQPVMQCQRLRAILLVTGSLGVVTTALQVWATETGQPEPAAFAWLYPYSAVLLAFAYGTGLWLYFSTPSTDHAGWLTQRLAAAGQMAFSNYLTQSLLFSLLFYGFGWGLFGKLGSAVTALLGLMVFAAQLGASMWWLGRFRFGPAEWLWRSLTYGQRLPLRSVKSDAL